MGTISLDAIVTGKLIDKFRGLAAGSSTSSGQQVLNALSGSSNTVTVAAGLNQGARTLLTSVKSLNSAVAAVNISKDTLKQLATLTDKLIELADRASSVGVGSSGRASLNQEFRKLGNSFEKIISNTKIGTHQIMTVQGLSEVFQAIGLDKDNSDSIAKVFGQFVIPPKDDALASEYTRGGRPVIVPAGAFRGPASATTYNIQKLTDSNVSGSAQIATGSNIFVDNDNILKQNPAYNSLFNMSSSGTLSTLKAGMLDRNFDTLAVNRSDGSTLIGTTQDLGANPSNNYVAYLIDSSGQVVHRFDDFSPNPGGSFEAATSFQISSDDKTISYIQRESDSGAGTRTFRIMQQSASSLSPTGGTNTVSETDTTTYNYSLGDPVSSFDTLKMNNDGSRVAYNHFDGSSGSYTTVFDGTTAGLAAPLDSFQFIDTDTLAYINASGGEIDAHQFGSMFDLQAVTGLTDIQHFSVLQSTNGDGGAFVLDSDIGSGQRRISLYTGGSATLTHSVDLQSTDTISSLSIAYNSSGQAEYGILGSIPSLSADSDLEFYRMTANSRASGQRFERMSQEFKSLFSSDANILTRANATRMKVDLKAMKEQIKKNLTAIDASLDSLQRNMDLARNAGLALIETTQTLTGKESSDTVAAIVREKIRKAAKGSLSEAENLEPMIIAALSLNVTA